MTPSNVMTIALERTGLSAAQATFVTRARQYLNMTIKDISQAATWRWLYKVGTITTSSGTREYQLATDVLYPRSARDTTNDRPMEIWFPEKVDEFDPDDDNTDLMAVMAITGRDTTNNAWNVDIIGTPQETATLKYRYYAFVADLTSSDDDTEFVSLSIPEWVQPALVHGTTALYMQQEENDSADSEFQRYLRVVEECKKINAGLSSDSRTRIRRAADYRLRDAFQPEEGSLT